MPLQFLNDNILAISLHWHQRRPGRNSGCIQSRGWKCVCQGEGGRYFQSCSFFIPPTKVPVCLSGFQQQPPFFWWSNPDLCHLTLTRVSPVAPPGHHPVSPLQTEHNLRHLIHADPTTSTAFFIQITLLVKRSPDPSSWMSDGFKVKNRLVFVCNKTES